MEGVKVEVKKLNKQMSALALPKHISIFKFALLSPPFLFYSFLGVCIYQHLTDFNEMKNLISLIDFSYLNCSHTPASSNLLCLYIEESSVRYVYYEDLRYTVANFIGKDRIVKY
jgi:hypothetical protein